MLGRCVEQRKASNRRDDETNRRKRDLGGGSRRDQEVTGGAVWCSGSLASDGRMLERVKGIEPSS